MGAIADEINGATTVLVKKVLEEYGDPGQAADDDDEPSATGEDSAAIDDEQPTTDADLTDDQSIALESEASESTADTADPTEDADGSIDPAAVESSLESTPGMADDADIDEADDADANGDTTADTQADPVVPDPTTLTETQLETLRAIHDRPTATQAHLAAQFDITGASISQRVNAIDGFDWADRDAFTEALFGSTDAIDGRTVSTPEPDGGTAAETTVGETDDEMTAEATVSETEDESVETDVSDSSNPDPDADDRTCDCHCADQLATITARLDRLDRRLADRSRSATGDIDAELAHKVVHACFDSEQISDDEELQILRSLMACDCD